MNCAEADLLATRERLSDADDERLGRHLASCGHCRALAADDETPADALVRARDAAASFRSALRRGASAAVASLLLAAALALRPTRPAPRHTAWTIEGDETGVVLVGPGVQRRGETLPVARTSKGART